MNRWIAFAAASLTLLLPAIASAQWPDLGDAAPVDATGQRDVAVIVAAEDYLLLPDVPGAIANANDWEVFFRNSLKIPNVYVLANQDATREGMLKFARTASQDAGPGSTIWWVFIGHGAPTLDGKDGLLVGVDAQQSVESLAARGVPQNELLGALQRPRATTVMILDACFSGRTADGSALAAGVQPVVAVQPAAALTASTVVLSAAKATEVAGALDGTPRPAFSYLTLGALRGWADDGDGSVTASEVLHYTRRQLRGVKGRQQTPQAAGNLTLVLSRGATERKPQMVEASAVVVTSCPEGQVRHGDSCVEPEKPGPQPNPVITSGKSEAELTLEYLKRRLVWQGDVVRQSGRILDGPNFYHAIGRPDLAEKWRSHKPVMWGTGIAMIVGGGVFMGVGIGLGTSDRLDGTGAGLAWLLSGALGGSFTWIGGILMTTFGFVGDYNPMSLPERKLAAEQFNQKLRDERGLGPEVDWQNEPANSGPFSRVDLQTHQLGLTFRF